MAKTYRGRDAFKRRARKIKSESRKRLAPKVDKKTRAAKHWGKYNNKRRPPSHTVPVEGELVVPKTTFTRIRPEAIRIRSEQEVPIDEVVSFMAESFVVTAPVHPVIVRRIGLNVELVWGADILAAAKLVKLKSIAIQIFEGNDEEARLVQLAEPLFRRNLTALQRAEHWVEWADRVLKSKGLFLGQPVPKKGRPEGGLLKAARAMPVYGPGSLDGRKKMLGRAYKIGGIPSDVKTEIKKAGLDDNQRALLAIASAGDAEAQHRKVAQLSKKLAEIPEGESPPLQPADTSTADEDDDHEGSDSDSRKGKRAPKDDDDNDGADTKESADDDQDDEETGEDSEGEDAEGSETPPPDTDLNQWRQFFKEHGGTTLWAYTPMTIRKEVIDWLTSRPCRAHSDIEPYVKDVFAGREKIEAQVLKAHAASKGFSEGQIVKYLNSHGYPRKKTNAAPGAPWIYKNVDPNYAIKQSSVTKAELEAPYEAYINDLVEAHSRQTATNLDQRKTGDDFYEV